MATNSEYTKVIKFLVGLNDSYSNARSQIIMKKTVPDLSEVYNLLDQDFSQTRINPISNASDFYVDGSESFTASINDANTPRPQRHV